MKRFLALLVVLLNFALSVNAQPEPWAMAYIDAYNSGDAARVEAFAQENFAPEVLARRTPAERKEMFERMWGTHGKFAVVDVDARAGEIVLGVKPERGEELTLTFSFDRASSRISGLRIDLGGPRRRDDDDHEPPLPPLKIEGNLAASLDRYLKSIDFSGAVLVARGDDVLFEKAYGLASRRYNVPNKISTRFDVGSITKDFTKVAIAQLAQAGKLALTDTVGKHLPNYPNETVRNSVTIAQLAGHTSGLGDIFTPEYFNLSRLRLRTPADYIAVYGDDPLQFEPGKGQRYSNYGYAVLGAIIEAASGISYQDYVQKHVFERAGMTGSGFFASDEIVPDIAMGHTRRIPGGAEKSEKTYENTLRLPVIGGPFGLSRSTARDLFKFDQALRTHALVKPAWSRWVLGGTAPPVDRNVDPDADPAPLTEAAALAGGAPGLNAVIVGNGARCVVVLANVDPPIAQTLGEIIDRALPR